MSSSPRQKILYVEDDPALARLVQKHLARAGYESILAGDGAEGIALGLSGEFDLLVCDFDLPVYNGLEVVHQLRTQGMTLPILMVTGSGDEVVAMEALQLGVADYILKDSQGNYLKLLPVVIRHAIEQQHLREAKEEIEQTLLRNDERHRALVEITGDSIWEVNAQGICTYVSPKVETLLGRQPAEILGVALLSLLERRETIRVLRAIGPLIRRKEAFRNLQTTHRHRQGHSVILETSAVPILDAEGRCLGYRGIDRDITDRHQAEEALRLSEQKFRGVVDNIAMGIAVVNRSMELTFRNRQLAEWFPQAIPTECLLCYRAFRQSSHRASCQGCPTALTLRDGKVHESVQEVSDGQGSRYFRIIASPIHDREGQVIAAINLVDDVTERRRAEQALAESERLMRSILDTSPNLIFTKDAAGRYLLVNPALAAFFQATPEEMLGKTDEEFVALGRVTPKVAEQRRVDDLLVLRQEKTIDIPETRVEMPDGTVRWLQTRKCPVDLGNNTRGVLGVAVDITERKQIEQNMAQAQKLEAVGQLAAGIAHEINTPIQYIGDNTRFVQEAFQEFGTLLPALERLLEACKSGRVAESLVREVEEILRQSDAEYYAEEVPRAVVQSLDGVERVAHIVRAMKEFAHPVSEEKQVIDLNRAVENTLTLARNEWKYVAEMETDFAADLPLIPCRPSDIHQVVLNLVVNAAQAIASKLGDRPEPKGTIRVSTRQEGPWVEITVQDTGTGIPEEIHSKVFNPFFTTKEIGKGTGQGLAIAHTLIVEKHGGAIQFESEVGRGTTFRVRLPRDGQSRGACPEIAPLSPKATF